MAALNRSYFTHAGLARKGKSNVLYVVSLMQPPSTPGYEMSTSSGYLKKEGPGAPPPSVTPLETGF